MNEEFKDQNIDNQPNDVAPAGNGDQVGKMFTQDEVNKIVSDRLARDRKDRSAQLQEDTREQELKARESRQDCREYLSEKHYPAELLDLLDTSNVERFKEIADELQRVYKIPYFVLDDPPIFTGPNEGNGIIRRDRIRDAFKPKA